MPRSLGRQLCMLATPALLISLSVPTGASGVAASLDTARADEARSAPADSVGEGDAGTMGSTAPPGNSLGLRSLMCALVPCLDFVTVYAPGGGAPPLELRHQVPVTLTLLGGVGLTALDATGDGRNDLGIAIQANAITDGALIGTDRFRLRIERLAGAPEEFPVRAELVARASQNLLFGLLGGNLGLERLQSLGYDARSTAVPRRFVTDLELAQSADGTRTVRAELQVAGAGDRLTVVNESFDSDGGVVPSERVDVQHADLTYRADPAAPETRVPSRAAVEVSIGTGFQTFILEREEPTVVDVAATLPDQSEIAATIDQLPARTELTVAEVGDGNEPDQQVAYAASGVAGQVDLELERLVDPGAEDDTDEPHRQVLAVAAQKLAADVTIDYSSSRNTFGYHASDRVPRVDVTVTDEVPLFKRADRIRLALEDLPPILSAEFSDPEASDLGLRIAATRPPTEGSTEPLPDHLGKVELVARQRGEPLPEERSCRPDGDADTPCDDGLGLLRDPELDGVVYEDSEARSLLFARMHGMRRIDIVRGEDLAAFIDTVADEEGDRRPFEVSLRTPKKEGSGLQDLRVDIDELAPGTRFQKLEKDTTECTTTKRAPVGCYVVSFSGEGPKRVDITGLNLDDLPEGPVGKRAARDLHLALTDLPGRLELSHASGGGGLPLELRAEGGRLGMLDVRMTGGIDERLPSGLIGGADIESCRITKDDPFAPPRCPPPPEPPDPVEDLGAQRVFTVDGFFYRDRQDQFVVHSRLRGLRRAFVDKQQVRDPRPPVPNREPVFGDRIDVEADLDSSADLLLLDVAKSDGTVCEVDAEHDTVLADGFLGQLNGPLPATMDLRLHTIDEGSESTAEPADPCDSSAEDEGNPDKLVEVEYDGPNVGPTGEKLFLSVFPRSLSSSPTSAALSQMPRELSLCQTSKGNYCSERIFGQSLPHAGDGSLRVHAEPRTLVDLVTDEGARRASLDIRDVAMQRGEDGDRDYIALHTGWFGPGPPDEQDLLKGTLTAELGDSHLGTKVVSFRAGDGFAADRRVLRWKVIAKAIAKVSTSGRASCSPNTGATFSVGIIDVSLTEALCGGG